MLHVNIICRQLPSYAYWWQILEKLKEVFKNAWVIIYEKLFFDTTLLNVLNSGKRIF